MPYRFLQLVFPVGVAYTIVLVYLWNTLLVLGPFIFTRLQAIPYVANASQGRNQFRLYAGPGMSGKQVGVGVPIRFKLIKLLKYPPLSMTLRQFHSESGESKTRLKNTLQVPVKDKTQSELNSDVCRLNLDMSDQCWSLIHGSEHKKPARETRTQNVNVSGIKPTCSLSNILKNCSNFRFAHGYDNKPTTYEEQDFPLAFAIKMHTSPEQAEQLLRTIYRPHNVYCIHVDRKAKKGVFETMKSISSCLDNVHVLDDRETVVYMSSAVVRAEIRCMKTLMKSRVRWRYYINLAGQEFPLRTNLETVMTLKRLHGANDIESYDHPRFQEWRFKNKFVIMDGKLEKTNVKKEPFGHRIQMSKGSAYGMFKREFVEFVLTDDVAQKFIAWLNDTSSPDENVWATLNTLPWAPGGSYVETRQTFNTHASRALIWSWDKVTCHGKFVRSVCVFGAGDLKWLTTRPNVIANKFNNDLDPVPLQCLESWINRRVRHPLLQTVDSQYIADLPHVQLYKNIDFYKLSPKYLQERKKLWLQKHSWLAF